ncbi:MAG: AI-2E family transporter [Bryobacteraceae bacterium]|nr:AI-2E family transporter [Bryobacteraceae bacterium]
MTADTTPNTPSAFRARLWSTIAAVTGTAVVLLVLWTISDALLLVFGAILLAILFRTLSEALTRYTPVPERIAFPLTLFLIAAFFAIIGLLYAPLIAEQFHEIGNSVPKAWEGLRSRLAQIPWARGVADALPGPEVAIQRGASMLGRISNIFSSTLGALFNFFIVVVLALFLAADPAPYRQGIIRLFPISRRVRAVEVLDCLGESLRLWLLGQLAAMLIIGVFTAIGLYIVGVPLALGLSLLAALFNFIPNVGPLIAGIPAVLLALTHGVQDALWVVVVYLVAQTIEGNFLTPMIQQRASNLPPALTIAAQIGLGLLFGFAGVALATPLTVVGMVMVRMLYIEDVLGDKPEPGEDSVCQSARR